MKTFTRSVIVESLHQETNLTHSECISLVEILLAEIKQSLLQSESIKISSFGSFTVKQKLPRLGRNPKTKKQAIISARKVIRFKPSESFKCYLNRR